MESNESLNKIMLKRDLFCSKPIKDICFRNDLARHHDTYSEPWALKAFRLKEAGASLI